MASLPEDGSAQGALRRAERLALLYRISQTFNSSLELDQVLDRVMDEVIVAMRAERGFLMLAGERAELAFRVARGLEQHTIEQPEFQVSRGIIERVAREGRPLLTSNAQDDQRLSARQSVMVLGLRSVMCVPLVLKGAVLGVIYVDNRIQAGIFSSDDLELLTAIASSAAVAIENARLYQVAIEKGRMERELQMARELQAGLLPRSLPQVAGWEFAARWQPARQVAGDFYDFVPCARGRVQIVIADVADKGMQAALFMALTRSIIRAKLFETADLAGSMEQANRLICADSLKGMFVTLFYAQIEPDRGHVTYVNAGHNPPLLLQSGDDRILPLTRTGMALGVDENTTYHQEQTSLRPGDVLLFYTDGVTEMLDPAGEEYGLGRLQDHLRSANSAPAEELAAGLQADLEAYGAGRELHDDLTLVVARRCPAEGEDTP